MFGLQWKQSVISNFVRVQNKAACDQSTAQRTRFVQRGASVRSIFQRAGKADFKHCQREVILPSLIPLLSILCVCLLGTVQRSNAAGGWSSTARASSAQHVSMAGQVLTHVK